MVCDEIRERLSNFSYRILGTDIDSAVLSRALKGIYSQSEIAGVEHIYLRKYFSAISKEKNVFNYKIAPDLKQYLKFRLHNLIDSNDLPVKFDVIFLRNVLIYFSTINIQRVIDKMVRHLKSGGYLFIGHSESLTSVNHNLKQIGSSVYQKN